MRKIVYLALVAFVAIAFSSCQKNNTNEPELFKLTDLQGLWQENNTEHYVRFTEEKADEAGYLLGREWDDSDWEDPDMTFEEFLIWNREQLGHLVNGWFQYKMEGSGNLTEIHFMDNGGAEIPKIYVISKLTDTDLEYYEKEYKNIKYRFSKVLPLDTYAE